MAFLDAMMDAYPDAGRLRLPQSHADQVGLYSTAFTYDAALAILAYLQDHRPQSLDRARLLGRALRYAQDHDPQYDDGRLRQAYAVGPYTRGGVYQADGFVTPSGAVNVGGPFGFTASFTGDQAWAGLALCRLATRTGDPDFLAGALRIGRLLATECVESGPVGGFTAGFGRTGARLPSVSTAHNADLVALFDQLVTLDRGGDWLAHRDRAARFVVGMWSNAEGRFFVGSSDGVAVDQEPVSLESQTHPVLALAAPRFGSPWFGSANGAPWFGSPNGAPWFGTPNGAPWFGTPRYRLALAFAARELLVTDTGGRRNSALRRAQVFTGVTVSAASRRVDEAAPIEPGLPLPDRNAVWFEGTAQFACALGDGPAGSAASIGQRFTLRAAQHELGAGQTVGGRPLPDGCGVVAASSPLHVGFADSGYYPGRHVGATAWYLLAEAGVNPLR